MRALIAVLLLTTAATPALAAEPAKRDIDLRSAVAERVREAREQRTERREQRAEQREARREQVQQRASPARGEVAVGRDATRSERQQRRREVVGGIDVGADRQVLRQQRADRREGRERATDTRTGNSGALSGRLARELQRPNRPVLSSSGQRIISPVVSTRQATTTRRTGGNSVSRQIGDHLQRSGIAERLADPRLAERWREDWRRDQRHDWRRWREYNRGLYRTGYYYDPFGFGYHRFGLGWQIWPAYYSSRYWLNDPYQYRLPYVGYPYRWVRYWDDAVLVDTRTGRVVDVIYDFFW